VTWVWNRWQRTAHLTVAGPKGDPLSPDNLSLLREQLTNSRDPNRPLMMANMVRVPVAITARLLRDPAYAADAVTDAARQMIVGTFAFEAMELGRAVHLSEIHAVLQSVDGVIAVDVDLLHLRDHDDLSPAERAVRSVDADPVQTHIRIYSARPTPADPSEIDRYQRESYEPGPVPIVLPAEQAYIADPTRDVVLSVVQAF
jgi:hypothetical protein